MIRLAVALLFAALVGCATHDPGTTPAGDHERQLLVMITAAPPHYRPGTSASGYGSGATRPRFDLAGLALARDHGMTLADRCDRVLRIADGLVVDDRRTPHALAAQ